jgi:hypothetical protein
MAASPARAASKLEYSVGARSAGLGFNRFDFRMIAERSGALSAITAAERNNL